MSEITSLTKDASFRYANALFSLALDSKNTSKYEKDLDKLLNLFTEDSNFTFFIKSPLYPRNDQLLTMKAICSKLKLSEDVTNTILVMTSKRRLFSLKEMILQFKDLYRLHKNELIVEISSAKNLSKPDLEVLKKSISSKIGSDIIVKSKTDPYILGLSLIHI